jgi:hypothetical protein
MEGEEDGAKGQRALGTVVRDLPSFESRCTRAGLTAACLELSECLRVLQ